MDIPIEKLKGITGFLNGQNGLHDREWKLSQYLKSIGKEILILDNLFNENKKLTKIIKCENIVLSTTGLYARKIDPILEIFIKMKYAPKKVIFMSENTALFFCEIARDLKKKYKTKFYYPDIIGNELIEIAWI